MTNKPDLNKTKIIEKANSNSKVIPKYIDYFKEQFRFHYWREATYFPNDGYLHDEYINQDIKTSTEWYQVSYKINVTKAEQKEAYDYIQELINSIINQTS